MPPLQLFAHSVCHLVLGKVWSKKLNQHSLKINLVFSLLLCFYLSKKKKNLVFSFIILHLTRQPPPSLRCKYLGILNRLVRMVTCLLFHYSFYLNSFCMLSCIYILAINVFPPNFFELYLNLVSA